MGLVGSTDSLHIHGHHPSRPWLKWFRQSWWWTWVCRSFCDCVGGGHDRHPQHQAAWGLHLLLPVSVCVGLLPAPTGAVPDLLQGGSHGLAEHSPSHCQMPLGSGWVWLEYICLHAISRWLQPSFQESLGSVPHVPVLPCGGVDGHLALSWLIGVGAWGAGAVKSVLKWCTVWFWYNVCDIYYNKLKKETCLPLLECFRSIEYMLTVHLDCLLLALVTKKK